MVAIGAAWSSKGWQQVQIDGVPVKEGKLAFLAVPAASIACPRAHAFHTFRRLNCCRGNDMTFAVAIVQFARSHQLVHCDVQGLLMPTNDCHPRYPARLHALHRRSTNRHLVDTAL